MNTEIEKRFESLEKRVKAVENSSPKACLRKDVMELNLTLPEADIGGLHFNEQKVHAVFDLKDDGLYHSRDILFLSARNIEDDNSRDILTEYLNSDGFRIALSRAYAEVMGVHVEYRGFTVSLPKENQGIKKYHGVDWWYWMAGKYAASAAGFCNATGDGYADNYIASAVGGCAPAFCVA